MSGSLNSFDPMSLLFGSRPSQGPNGVGDAGYMSPDQLGQMAPPSTGMTGASLADAYKNLGTGSGATGGLGAGLGFNIGTGQLAMSGLSALGNLWSAFSANSLAKKQLDTSTMFANANLTNQIKSYNTSLSDRATARGVAEGQTPDQVRQYVAANSLSR